MGSGGHIAGEGNAATVKRDTAGFLGRRHTFW